MQKFHQGKHLSGTYQCFKTSENSFALSYRSNEVTVRVLKSALREMRVCIARHDCAQSKVNQRRIMKSVGTQFPMSLYFFNTRTFT